MNIFRSALSVVLKAGFKWLYQKRFEKFIKICEELPNLVHSPLWFVKVGANDGITGDPFSCLSFFNYNHWSGLFIEPVPYIAERLRQNFPNEKVIVSNVAIGPVDGHETFYYVNPIVKVEVPEMPVWADQLGSFQKEHILKHFGGSLKPYIQAINVPTKRLSTLLDCYKINRPCLLHIDAEGFDFEVLKTIDFNRHAPLLIFAEHKHLERSQRRAMFCFLRRLGYRVRRYGGDCLCLKIHEINTLHKKRR